MHDFLDNLGAKQHRKMTERNATKEETRDKKDLYEGIWDKYYNSESEGKEFKDAFYAPENYGTWETQTQEET